MTYSYSLSWNETHDPHTTLNILQCMPGFRKPNKVVLLPKPNQVVAFPTEYKVVVLSKPNCDYKLPKNVF